MRKALTITCLPFMLSGCDAVLGIDNFQACLDQIEASFPEASGISDSDFSEDIEGFGEVDDYGNFEYQLRETSDEVRVGCKGNQSDRTLIEITFEGDTKMPSSMEQWSY